MFDFKFDWCKEMECGHEIIDGQHKILFQIGRDIEQLVTQGCSHVEYRKLLDIIGNLRDYVAYHFYYEEDLMRQVNYGDYEKHKKMHDDFTAHIINLDLKELEKHPQTVLTELKQYLQDWLFQHILNADHAFCQELIKNQQAVISGTSADRHSGTILASCSKPESGY